MLCRIWNWITRVFEELFPIPFYIVRGYRVRRRANVVNILNRPEFAGYGALTEAQLTARLEQERTRAAAMDEKTFKMTLSLSIGLTVLGSVTASFVKEIQGSELQEALTISIAISLFYILAGGVIALGALKTLPSYGYGTRQLIGTAGVRRQRLAENLARQETFNIFRHLRNEAAYQTLRNGFYILFVTIVLFSGEFAIQTMKDNSANPVEMCTQYNIAELCGF